MSHSWACFSLSAHMSSHDTFRIQVDCVRFSRFRYSSFFSSIPHIRLIDISLIVTSISSLFYPVIVLPPRASYLNPIIVGIISFPSMMFFHHTPILFLSCLISIAAFCVIRLFVLHFFDHVLSFPFCISFSFWALLLSFLPFSFFPICSSFIHGS